MRHVVVLPLLLGFVAACDQDLAAYDDPRVWLATSSGQRPDATPAGLCAGAATECDWHTPATCGGLGCGVGTGCYSPSRDLCAEFLTEAVCNAVPGDACFWAPLAGPCVAADTCSSLPDERECLDLYGAVCAWGAACRGEVADCLDLGYADCVAQPGCEWMAN